MLLRADERRDRRWRARVQRSAGSSSTRLTFDCMVIDLTLPDGSGYELLEKHGQGDALLVPAGHRLHRPRARARGGAAAAPLFALDHRQGRALARAAARRGDAVPAPGRVERCRPTSSECSRRRASARRCSRAAASCVVEDDVRNIFALIERARAARREGRDRAQRPRGARPRCERHRRHRPRADGHHDAGDGRPHRDRARSASRPRSAQAADHRAHRQGDARRPGAVPRRPAPTTTSPSRSTSTSCCRCAACGCRSDRRVDRAARCSTLEIDLLAGGDVLASTSTTSATTRGRRCGAGSRRRWSTFDCRERLAAAGSRAARARRCSRRCCSYLTVQVSEMFRDPRYFRALRERGRAACCRPIRR